MTNSDDDPPKAALSAHALPTFNPLSIPENKLSIGPPKATAVASVRRLEQKEFPDKPRKTPFQTPTTIENVEHMLANAGVSVRYNVIKKKLEINLPKLDGTPDNRDNVTMTSIVSLASLNGMQTGLIPSFIEVIGDKNSYNPVKDWIKSRPWDGEDRLESLYDTVTTTQDYPDGLKRTLLKKWLLSGTAAAVMDSGFHNRGVLTLQGKQGIGKTSWVLSLLSDPGLRDQCIKVDHHLDSSNKDSILGAVTHWIVEIGELDSSFKKDIARLKGFLTSNSDKVRRPYARVDSEYPRRTVFIATVNDSNFLVGTTGNSRWWTIAVIGLDFNHDIDMQQVYAQLTVDLDNGAQWWLTGDEEQQLALINKPHESISVVRETILGHLDMALIGNPSNPSLTPSELLVLLQFERPTNPQAKECAGVLRELLGEPKRIHGRDKWRVPCRIIEGSPRRLKPIADDDNPEVAVTSIPGHPPARHSD